MHIHPHRLVRLLVAGLMLVAFTEPVAGQQMGRHIEDFRPATRTFAITNANVVQSPGRTIEGATVIIRNGLIEAVGLNVQVPFDAHVIEADTLYVYAGLIDGLSHTGIPQPRQERDRERVDRPGDPPYERAGIEPQRRVPQMLQHDDASVENLRKLGFTTAHVVPRGRMLPGRGAIVQLAGRDPGEMTLQESASLFAQFESAQGVYPATTMAILARWRQMFREADRRQTVMAAVAAEPTGIRRPDHDAVLDAFHPVINRDLPVVFRTETSLDARRAIRLSEELGFRLILANLKEGWYLLDELRDNEPPIFLSLELPERDDNNDRDTLRLATNGDRVLSYADIDDEIERLKQRRAEFREQYYRQAADLHEAGVRFGFATFGTEINKVRENLRTIIEHGLPPDAALAALTVNPAQIFGLEGRMGTVEAGKIANLVLATGPFFDEDSRIRMVFVDGRRFEYDVREIPEEEDPEVDVTPAGAWDFTFDSPDGPITGTLDIRGAREAFTGVLTLDIGTGDFQLRNIVMEGNVLTFDVTVVVEGQTYDVAFTGTVDQESMRGSGNVPGMGSFPVRARRVPDRDA